MFYLGTTLLYSAVLFISAVFGWLSELFFRRSKPLSCLFRFLAFLVPLLVLTLRENIGTDYLNYVRYFDFIAEYGYANKEFGYVWLNQILSYMGMPAHSVFVVMGFFTLIFAFRAFPEKGLGITIFFFICIFYLYEGFSAIRQGFAIAVMVYAFKKRAQGKKANYIALFLLAFSFHYISALVLFVLYPLLSKIRVNSFLLIVAISLLFLIVIYTDWVRGLIQQIIAITPGYSWYVDSKFMKQASLGAGILGPLIKVSIFLVILYMKDSILKKFPEANVYINFSILYVVFYLLHIEVSIMGRVEHVFTLAHVITLVYFVRTFTKQGRIFVLVLLGSFYYMMFLRYIYNGAVDVDNSVHISPYQHVFMSE